MSEIVKIFIAVLVTFLATYLIERRKEKLVKIKCLEILNKKVVDIGLPSLSMSNSIVLKSKKNAPNSEFINVNEIYTAVYLIKNVSTKPIGHFVIKALREGNVPLWFHITLGRKKLNPDWDGKLKKLLQETMANEEIGWTSFHIPYLNPYRSSREKVFLIISSYLPLDMIRISGGSEGLSFQIRKMHQN